MTLTARISQNGGPDVIEWITVDLPPPSPGEVRMRNKAIGLNFIDTYHRSGAYPIALPSGLGVEAAGFVEAVGEGVSQWRIGDRVCCFGPTLGAYAEARNIAASMLFAIPDNITDELAAAAMLKACTAEFLVERCAKVEAGWPVLVHAAAGGVGLILVQWLKTVGAVVIGTVSTESKAAMASAAGADHIILTSQPDMESEVRRLTNGKGVKTVFDGVGSDTWNISLNSCAPRALIVSYGNASGPVTGVALGTLGPKGSLFVTRPTIYTYYAEPAERMAGAARVFERITSSAITITIGQRYPMAQAAQAHRDLEGRRTSGSTVLLP